MDISSMLEVQVKEETDVKENDIASVRFRRLHCTACDAHIGSAPAQINNMFQHPVLRTLLCANCREFYGDGTFEQGDDATDMFCRWCANGGNLYCCSYCSNTFCYKCIRRNFTSLVRKKIEADEKWKCFVCNPTDLYSARAICWALLEHVQTVTRILKSDKKINTEQFDIRMNLDESPCCPRRRKRKRRRLESNSEEEDETYMPEPNGLPVHNVQRKQFKNVKLPIKINPNGKIRSIVTKTQSVPIPIRPRPSPFLTGPSQSMTKSESSIVKSSESIVLPSSSVINSNTSLSRYDSNVLQKQPSLYHTTFMNSAGSNTYIRAPATVNPATRNRIILPAPSLPPPSPSSIQSSTSYQPPPIQSSTSYQPPHQSSSQNTMVSIPNPTDKRGRSLFLLPKLRKVDLTLTPNIIDLDSDSDDEPTVVEQQNNSTVNGYDDMDVVDISCDKVVPVALTWENSDDDGIREEQPLREMCTTLTRNVTSFSEIMLPHSQELDKLLSDVKEKVYCFSDLNNSIQDELAVQQKIKQFCWNMRDAVLQLANINDRIVREYNGWRRSQETETETPSSVDENVASQENIEIPLDMTCINASDTESDCEGLECRIKKPSDLVKSSNIFSQYVENLLFSKKTNVVHRGIGDDNVLSVDKATQVYNISRDYEEHISSSILTKSNNDSKTDNSVLKQTSTPDKNFGKYEEQFIFYLQQIEDHRIQTEDAKSLADSDEIPLQELIETNSPFNSHLFQNIDLPDISTDESKICEQEKSDLSDHINAVNDITDTLKSTIDDNQKIVNDSDSDIRTQEINDIRIQEMTVLEEKLQQTHDNTTDGETTMSNNEDAKSSINGSNMVNMEASASKGNEEDCTIIDD
ncbi:transcriptional regulator atrx [Lasius niger]|uniref:Transcriptional regulator atrx n=1 Tax=Lasius niger TaxID=67767 RepID=A0A0J7L7C1_LASNI|nr:transcriptional regulator atrx [Lasius niger]